MIIVTCTARRLCSCWGRQDWSPAALLLLWGRPPGCILSYHLIKKKIFLIWYQSVLPCQERKCLRAMGWRPRESWEGARGSWWRSKRPPWSSWPSCWCCWLPGLTGWAWKWRERAWNFGNQLESHCNAAQPIDQKPLLSDVTVDSDQRTVFSDRKEANIECRSSLTTMLHFTIHISKQRS